MVAPRKIFSAIGATQQSARDAIAAIGPGAIGGSAPLPNQVLTWNGSAYVPMAGGGAPPPGAGGTQFIFKPSGPADPTENVYDDWATLCGVIAALPQGALPGITFAESFVIPSAGMPVNGWFMGLGIWRSIVLATGAIVVTVPDGVYLDMWGGISDGLIVEVFPTTIDGCINWSGFPLGGVPRVFQVGRGGCLRNSGTKAAILTPGGGTYVVFATQAPTFAAFPSVAPFVRGNADGTDVVIASQSFSTFYGSLPDNWVIGLGLLIYQSGVDSKTPSTPGWAGTILPLDSVQAVLNPLAVRGARKVLIYTSGVINPNETDTYNDWATLYQIYTLLPEPKEIALKQVGNTQLHVPSGIWNVRKLTSVYGIGANGQLILDDGAVLHNLHVMGEGVVVGGNSSSPCLTWDPPANPGDPTVVAMFEGTNLVNEGTAPMIVWDRDASGGEILILGMLPTSNIFTVGPASVIDVSPGGAYPSGAACYMFEGSSVGMGSISGTNGPGTAMFQFQLLGGTVDLRQPTWGGSPLSDFTAFHPISISRVNIQVAPIASGLYTLANGSELVRVAPDGSLTPIDVVLPDPTLCPDETVLVKKTNVEVATAITISSAGAGLIDGAPTDPWPATAYFSQRYTSDGGQWLKN